MSSAVCISDNRMQVLAERLQQAGAEVIWIRDQASADEAAFAGEQLELLVLPVRGVEEGGKVTLPFGEVSLERVFDVMKAEAMVFTGTRTPYLQKKRPDAFCFFEDRQVVLENAALTAEGVLYLMLSETPGSIFSYSVDLLGYGNTGREIAALLSNLAIPVRVVTRVQADGPVLSGRRLETLSVEMWREQAPGDIIINTIPACMVDMALFHTWKKRPKAIIDLASGKIGVAEALYAMPDIKIIPAPPLPGLVAGETAGEILYGFVKRHLPEGSAG